MADGIYGAVSGAIAASRQLEVISNNLANTSTAGFKGGRMAFSEVLAKASVGKDAARPDTGGMVQPGAVQMDMRGGALKPTGNKLDLAIEGPGFITVQGPGGEGEQYTRGGSMMVRADGTLTEGSGRALLDTLGNPIQVPAGKEAVTLAIDARGQVRAGDAVIGTLKLVEIARPETMQRVGDRLLSGSGATEAEATKVRQGYIEASNVNPITGVTSLITASRAYETLHRVISTFNEVNKRAAGALARDA